MDELADRLGADPVRGLWEQEAGLGLDGVAWTRVSRSGVLHAGRSRCGRSLDPLVALLVGAVMVSLWLVSGLTRSRSLVTQPMTRMVEQRHDLVADGA